jgi:outer membrane phospholipase A
MAGALHGYLQIFGGYGQSMVDDDRRQTKTGPGVTIAGWR